MGIGLKIKEYRTKAGLTQKALADELHVTYQAVSRWENDDAEPSFDTLKDMCRLFNCTTDDLFEISKPVEEKKEESPQIIERVIIKEAEQKPVLGVCEQCNKPIYEADDLKRINESYVTRSGRTSQTHTRQRILCNECNEIRLLQIKRTTEKAEKERLGSLKKRRILSFIFPTLLAILFIVLGIISFVKGKSNTGIGEIVIGVFGYTFLATMILNNTFLTDMWTEVTSWGFVRFPGIIFELSLDGIVFLIAVKILFFILGILIAIAAAVLATIFCAMLSVFVYPFALGKNIKGIE